MKIQVYGSGCPNCVRTEELLRKTADELGVQAAIEKVTDYPAIAAAGIMATPAVSIDGVIKISGRVPKAEEVRGWLVV